MPQNPNNPSPGFRKRTPRKKKAEPAVVEPTVSDTDHTAALLRTLEQRYDCQLTAGQVKVNEATVRVSYLNEEKGVAFEIYPKQGGLNSGIKRKINSDVLQLSLLRDHWSKAGKADVKCGVVFGDQTSLDDYRGKNGPSWARRAAELHGVQLLVL